MVAREQSYHDQVETTVSDRKLVEQKRQQILRAAIGLFSRDGFYRTTIQRIAREAGVSTGSIYQYFGDKEDVLYLALRVVLERYENEIPPLVEGVVCPLERLMIVFATYVRIVDSLREATVLAYRSTKSLPRHRRRMIQEAERRSNAFFEEAIEACVADGLMRPVEAMLLAYQQVLFGHAWALKGWALRDRYSLESYIAEGERMLIEPFLTERGRARRAEIGGAGKGA